MLNKAILMGRLTRDPELRYTPNGNVPVVTFTLAVDRNYSGNGRERQTDFIDIVAWRHQAEFVSQWFTKGMMAIVVGSIQSRRWQDKNGNNRTSIEVVAENVQFGETKKSREQSSTYAGSRSAQPGIPDVGDADDFSEITDDGEVPF